MENCLFCKIGQHKVKAEIIFENERLFVISDIHPNAKIHLLVIPKEHIEFEEYNFSQKAEILSELLLAARDAADRVGILKSGFRLVINTGENSGRGFDHLHIHVLGGEKLGDNIQG